MTNREYLESLDDEWLAMHLFYQTWEGFDLSSINFVPDWMELVGVRNIKNWLKQEKE